jgi:hypothetical protein
VVRAGRQTTWKQLGVGSFNVNLMKRNDLNQLMIIPLENGKKNTCMLEMRIDGEAPSISDLFEKIADAKVCCDDAFLIGAFYECPLTWSDETPEGAKRLKDRWPRIAERLGKAIQNTHLSRTTKSQAYWCMVLRSLECERDLLQDAVRPLKEVSVGNIMHGVMPSDVYDCLIETRWLETDIFEWASSIAREVSSRVLDPMVDGKEVDPGYKQLYGAHLERFSEWLSVRFIVCDVRLLLVRAIDKCLE